MPSSRLWLPTGRNSYNSHMRSVNVAELKNQLSAYLHRVRAGEELLIRDRNLPIAKIVPLDTENVEADEYSLVASGQMTLPKKPFREDRFWAIVGPSRTNPRLKNAIKRSINAEREENDAGVLGHKRPNSHLRPRPGK
jgi:prevent-host-death family protein